MSDAPKMGFLAALQKGKQTNEQEAKAPEAKPNPVSESRPNPLLAALGKAPQKVDSKVVQENESAAKTGGIFAKPAVGVVSGEDNGVGAGTGTGLITSPTNRILAAAAAAKKAEPQANYDHLFDTIPENFQEMLDKFDKLMIRDQGVNDLNVGHFRDYVKRIFIELKENPEYDGLIIDRDVHNVIKFMRAVKGQAQELAVEKKTKAAKTQANKAKSNRFAAIAGNLDLGGKMPATIQDMSNLDDLSLEMGDLE